MKYIVRWTLSRHIELYAFVDMHANNISARILLRCVCVCVRGRERKRSDEGEKEKCKCMIKYIDH